MFSMFLFYKRYDTGMIHIFFSCLQFSDFRLPFSMHLPAPSASPHMPYGVYNHHPFFKHNVILQSRHANFFQIFLNKPPSQFYMRFTYALSSMTQIQKKLPFLSSTHNYTEHKTQHTNNNNIPLSHLNHTVMTSKRKDLFSYLHRVSYAFGELPDESNLATDLLAFKKIVDTFIDSFFQGIEKPRSSPADVRYPSGGLLKNNCSASIPGPFRNFSEQDVLGRGDVANGLVDSSSSAGAENSGSRGESCSAASSKAIPQYPELSSDTCHSENDNQSLLLTHRPKRRCNSSQVSNSSTESLSPLQTDPGSPEDEVLIVHEDCTSNSVQTGLTLRCKLPLKGRGRPRPQDTSKEVPPCLSEISSIYAEDEDNLSKLTPNSFASNSDQDEPSPVCIHPPVFPKEFSSPTKFLNQVSATNFYNRPSTLTSATLQKKVKMFQSFQEVEYEVESYSYIEQDLAVAVSNDDFTHMFNKKRDKFLKPQQDFYAIKKIVLIPRSKVGMAYEIDHLGQRYHGTVIRKHSSFKKFLSIFDHVPIQRIHYESEGFTDEEAGIQVLSATNNISLKNLSQRLW